MGIKPIKQNSRQMTIDHPDPVKIWGNWRFWKRVCPRVKWLWRPCLWWNLILKLLPNKFVYILITEKEGCLLLAWICYDTNISYSFKALVLANIIQKLWCRHSINNIFSFPRSQTPTSTTVSPCFRQSLLTLDFHKQISLLCSFSFVMEHKYR